MVTDSGDQTLQIVNRLQIFPDLIPDHGFIVQFFDGILPLFNQFYIHQRLLHEASHHARAHGSLCLVQHPEKRTSLLFLPKRLHQFQISAAGAVDQHKMIRHIGSDPAHMLQITLLGLFQIDKQSSCRKNGSLIISQAQSFNGHDMEMFHQCFVAEFIIKIPGIQGVNRNIHPVFQIIHIYAADHQRLITDDLRRCVFIDLIHQFSALVHFSDIAFAGADIRNTDAKMIFHINDTHKIIVFCIVDTGGV